MTRATSNRVAHCFSSTRMASDLSCRGVIRFKAKAAATPGNTTRISRERGTCCGSTFSIIPPAPVSAIDAPVRPHWTADRKEYHSRIPTVPDLSDNPASYPTPWSAARTVRPNRDHVLDVFHNTECRFITLQLLSLRIE